MARKAKKAQTPNERSSKWVGILYEESLPKDWQAQLDGLQYALSPWHDKDVDADGKIKKKHRHIFLNFPSLKSFSQVKAIFDALNQPHPQVCKNQVGAIRYFCHLDNPEKAQYDLKDCVDHGVGIEKIIALTGDKELVDKANRLKVCEIVALKGFLDYDDLYDFCVDQGLDELEEFVYKKSRWVSAYIAGKAFKRSRELKAEWHRKLIDAITGRYLPNV